MGAPDSGPLMRPKGRGTADDALRGVPDEEEASSARGRVVDLLTAMGLTMKRKGDVHRTRAYMHAANAIMREPAFDRLLAEGRLQMIRGVGPAIEKKILAFVERGERPSWIDERAVAEKDGGAAEGIVEVPERWRLAPFAGAPDLHCHTTWSDGTLTLEQVVTFAERLGQKAIGISDHSGSLRIARGLKPAEVRAQWEDIARLQAQHPDIRILKGTECDILPDGRLDHPRDVLEGFDYVIGSLHQQLRLPEREQTSRVLRALDDPHLTILGHPTTRVPRHRPRANLDLPTVFEAAAANGVALEVNGNPGRIDLDEKLARQALEAGCQLALASDGHSAREMLELARAREIAQAAGATPGDIVNFELL